MLPFDKHERDFLDQVLAGALAAFHGREGGAVSPATARTGAGIFCAAKALCVNQDHRRHLWVVQPP